MVGSLVSSRCGAFPPVDSFCVGGHAVEEAGDELDVSAAASGEAELPQFCGGTVVVVDRLIRGIGVDLVGAVAVDLCPDAVKKSGQLRFVVGAHAFARGAPLGFGGHDPDGTVFQRAALGQGSPADIAMAVISNRHAARPLFQRLRKPSADYIQHDPSTRSHATERIMIGLAHRCLVSLETTAVS
jgi:hypothetical protein